LKEAPYAFGSTFETESRRSEADWRQGLTTRTRFVAEVDGVVAGTVSGSEGESTGVAAMTAMWVDPGFRRRGVGDALVKHVVEWASVAGYAHMALWVAEVNVAAQRLYESNGFVRTGAVQDLRPGELELEMSRPLR
jgi:ribosomal protein S18 acetylase RimI-like enzyme